MLTKTHLLAKVKIKHWDFILQEETPKSEVQMISKAPLPLLLPSLQNWRAEVDSWRPLAKVPPKHSEPVPGEKLKRRRLCSWSRLPSLHYLRLNFKGEEGGLGAGEAVGLKISF